MPPPQHIDRQTFLRRLGRSGLVNALEAEELIARLPESNRGRVLARALVEQGVLTRFQAEQVLAGRTRGFLVGPYRVLEQLGSGGMGCVFKAQHGKTGAPVALKAISQRLLKSNRAVQFFLREVRTLSQLEHPNIVRALDSDKDGDRHYLVMEYVDGPNLDQVVRQQGPLPVAEACDFICQAAEALHYAAEKGMIHRDIKPANLLLETRDAEPTRVKITDFGLARLGAPGGRSGGSYGTILTRANSVMGTPDYIAPEQARSLHNTDLRSDLYSLGCTFYYLLTSEVPFPGGSTLEKLVRHSVEEPVPVEHLRPEVPTTVARIIRGLMAKDPEARFQTHAELLAALSPFRAGAHLHLERDPSRHSSADVLPTPAEDSENEGVEISEGENALIGTLTPDASATPASTTQMQTPTRRLRRRRLLRLVRWLLLVAASLVGGLILAFLARWLLLAN